MALYASSSRGEDAAVAGRTRARNAARRRRQTGVGRGVGGRDGRGRSGSGGGIVWSVAALPAAAAAIPVEELVLGGGRTVATTGPGRGIG